MPKFKYSALRDTGERVAGLIEGNDRAVVIGRLADQGLHPIDVAIADQEVSAGGMFSLGGGVVGKREITIFTRELAWLLQAGITLNRALEILSHESFSKTFSAIISTLQTEIRKGRNFRDALVEAGIFPPFYLSMVEVGEASGSLASVLDRIATTRDREQRIRSRVTSALMYPSLLVVLSIGAVTFIMVSVVPNIKEMITGSGAPIPQSAQFVIGVSDWLLANGMMAAIALPAAALIIAVLLETSIFRSLVSGMVARIPLVGSVLMKAEVVQFCRILGTLIASGMSLPDSLRLIRPSTANPRIAKAVGEMETALRRGEDFIEPLERSRVFPGLLARMLKVGNETGNLTASLVQVTEILEEELERAVDRSLTLLGPLIILILSAFVAFIIVSLMSAIISINDLAL
jgi:general secretion pathway protein F